MPSDGPRIRHARYSRSRRWTAWAATSWSLDGRGCHRPRRSCGNRGEADGLLPLVTDRVDAELLDAAPGCGRRELAVGVDNIDLEAAAARGLPVGNTPDVLTEATADFTFALLLAPARRLPEGRARRASGRVAHLGAGSDLGVGLAGTTLGIIGRAGSAGRRPPRRGFPDDVLHAAHHRRAARGAVRRRLRHPALPAHARDPPPDQRRGARAHEADRDPGQHRARRRRRPARAGAALIAGTIAGAALDVTDPEPLPPDDPLHRAPNVIIIPTSARRRRARERMADLTVDNLLAGLDGRPMPHQAEPRMSRVAVVDIGSNSTRLLVVEMDDGAGRARARSAARPSPAWARASTPPVALADEPMQRVFATLAGLPGGDRPPTVRACGARSRAP